MPSLRPDLQIFSNATFRAQFSSQRKSNNEIDYKETKCFSCFFVTEIFHYIDRIMWLATSVKSGTGLDFLYNDSNYRQRQWRREETRRKLLQYRMNERKYHFVTPLLPICRHRFVIQMAVSHFPPKSLWNTGAVYSRRFFSTFASSPKKYKKLLPIRKVRQNPLRFLLNSLPRIFNHRNLCTHICS